MTLKKTAAKMKNELVNLLNGKDKEIDLPGYIQIYRTQKTEEEIENQHT